MQAHGSSTDKSTLAAEAVSLLQQLIAIPSFSTGEDKTADLLEAFLTVRGISAFRNGNNIWARNKHFDAAKPTILLNSHHDTVKPNPTYTLDPFNPVIKENRLYGLGSNDAGGALVSLLAVFLNYYAENELQYNFIFAASAEEEISGKNGIERILPELDPVDFAIVGEPTQMHLAVAEKGLLVLDCISRGKAGHAAREEGDNAIYKALKDIEWFRTWQFPKISETLGAVKMSVTVIQAGSQHNVVPAECTFTVDVRCTDAYTFEELLETIRAHVSCEVAPRSLRLRPSSIPAGHPFVQAAVKAGRNTYGSPTTSDQALMPFASVKMGPGDSARSHTADEFIFVNEITEGIELYIRLLDQLVRV